MDSDRPDVVTQARRLIDGGRLDEAQALLLDAFARDDGNPLVLRYLGVACTLKGDWKRGRVVIEAALARGAPADAFILNALSICTLNSGDVPAALAAAAEAVWLDAAFAEAHLSLGNALNAAARLAEAEESLHTVLALKPTEAAALVNLANTCRLRGEPEAALARLDEAEAMGGPTAPLLFNRGNVLQDLRRFEEAIAAYGQALEIEPDNVDVHWNRSLCRLRLGRFEAGWREYEWRWRRPDAETPLRPLPAPRLTPGADVRGKTVHLHCEQGYGDCIQFLRFAPELATMGCSVVVEAYPALIPLVSAMPGVSAVVPFGTPVEADFECPLMSLPDLSLAWRTPTPVGRYIAAPSGRRARMLTALAGTPRPRIGIANQGSPTHKDDARRSFPLDQLARRLPAGPGYVHLCRDASEADVAAARASGMLDVSPLLADFGDTAACLAELDLLVGVDTAAVHLAGALGLPVWTVLQYDADWRWGTEAAPHAWYASMTLYRQAARDDWTAPLAQVVEDLRSRFGS